MENLLKSGSGVKLEHLTFSVLDYILFAGMLVVSALIGIYFAVFKKQNTTEEYLLGGKNMGVFPVAISLAASYVSGIMILGMPAEIYLFGTLYFVSCISGFLMSFVIANVYLPVFYKLQLTSSFEYLTLRFDRKVRITASFVCLVGMVVNMPIVMYVPALTFNLVSGYDMEYVSPVVCLVCIFYTTIGGLRAVVWTDTVQFITMIGAILVVLVLGTPNEGGLSNIIQAAEDGDRIHFFDTDTTLYTRATFLSVTLGVSLGSISAMGVNQMCIQRFLSVPSLAKANKVLYIFCAAISIIKGVCLFSGLIMFARYKDCDPVSAGVISKADQILPYYVMDTTRNIPGIPGLFIAGIFGAALSTLSSCFNTSCGIIYKDFICLFISPDISEARASSIMKAIVVILGICCTAMTVCMKNLSNVLQVSNSFGGVTSGAMLGIFSMGMLSSRANSIGTMSGALSSLFLMAWMVYGSNQAFASDALQYPTKPFSIDKCDFDYTENSTMPSTMSSTSSVMDQEKVFFLYRISFMWYSVMGTMIVALVGLPVSYLTSPPSLEQTRPEYFSPVLQRFLPKNLTDRDEDTIDKEKGSYMPVNIEMQDFKKTDCD